jgi:hypothetical protein
MGKNPGYLVQTTAGKKGLVAKADIPKDPDAKVPVKIVDDAYQLTGEKLMCDPSTLKIIGNYD